ncbi:MAG: porin family protein [Candidatus Neomarinimicrobiota bacterium]
MNFKSQLLAIVLIIISVSSVRAQYAIGIFGGVNNSNLIGDAPPGSTYESDPGLAVGILGEINITSDVKISLQPMFQRKGATIAYSVISEREPQDSIDININYFSIPILMKVYGVNNLLYVSGGFDIGYKLDASFKRIGSGTEKDISDSFNDFDIAAIFGVGAQFNIGLFYIFIEGRYSQGLGNISNPKAGEPEELNPSFRTTSLMLFAGLTYTFGGKAVDD